MAKQEDRLYLIDGSSYIYRAYHATGGLTTSKGFPTGAVFGFANMLVKALKERLTDRVAVVFDARGPTFRHEKYAEYKANRPAMPEDLQEQIPKIHELVDAYNLPSLSAEGFEADDIIATLIEEARERGRPVTIVSGDKDLLQLVGDDVDMWDPQRDKVYTPAEVEKKYGVTPDKIGDLLALMGDSSDNIPGVPGVGQKTAAALLQEYGSIEGIYENLESLTKKTIKKKLAENKDKAELSRSLVQLVSDVNLESGIADLVVGEPDTARLRELFTELEFKRLLDELPAGRGLDFDGYGTLTDIEAIREFAAGAAQAGRFAVDLEATSHQPVRADLVGISMSYEEGRACYIPVAHEIGEQPDKKAVLDILKPLLEDESIEKIGQNIKYDAVILKKEGIDVNGIGCDTMLASYVLDPSRRGHSLGDLSQLHLNHKMIPITDLIGTGRGQIPFSRVDITKGSVYACEDADVTFRVGNILCPKIEEEGLGELFRTLEIPIISVLVDMELAGVKVDVDYLYNLSHEFGDSLVQIEDEIYAIAGGEFNINSTKQLAEILFDRIGLKPTKKTKTGASTSLEVLEKLALEHPLPSKILEYRSIFKLKSTYVDALAELVNPKTGRIHTSYNQAVAATGRLSSSDPNLQNIPIRTPEGRKIRKAFIPEKGYVFVSADYSQIELRMMAHLSGDERLAAAFASGEDVHAITAAGVFGGPAGQVTPEMRRKAKAINFGIIYGMGAFRLADQLGVGLGMAKQYLEDYYATYSGVRRYMEEVPEKAKRDGYVTTILGRKRYLPDLNSTNKIAQQAAQRVAVNTTMQGSAADLIKLAMIRIHEELKSGDIPARMILQVHDELILEVEEHAARDVEALMKSLMENVYPLRVPLLVDTAVGHNWEEAH